MPSKQELANALIIIREAADNWCDYLDENDREQEIPLIEEAISLADDIMRYFQ